MSSVLQRAAGRQQGGGLAVKDEPFISPSRGFLTFEAMVADLVKFVQEDPEASYKLIIGTDSMARDDLTFVTAIIIHRVGRGARYYYRRHTQRKINSLRQKIFYETALSLALAQRLVESLRTMGQPAPGVEIHLDVGPQGETRELIRDVVGMVTGSGFHAEIKPHAYGASKVADRYTK
nr:MAG: hypothetical protein DIU70_06750 [Bacillota bacterium]